MAKDGFLTPKAIANRIKSKGLQKLRWYCQVCEKQCRDENGFKCHLESESHQRRILLVAESPEKYINNYSAEFQADFMKLLSTRYGTRRVQANHVYQEYISDRQHLHMNATKWTTLTEFVKHLGKEGLAIVDETPKGWFMQWIDRSPKALARQEAIAKKERMEMDDEQREQKMIQEQMARAAAAAAATQQSKTGTEDGDDSAKELVRDNEEEKIKLNLSLKPTAAAATGAKPGLIGSGSLLKPKSLSALAAKKPNPFKSASASTLSSTATAAKPSPTQPSTVIPLPSALLPTSSKDTRKRPMADETMDAEAARKRRFADTESTDKDRHNSSKSIPSSFDDRSRQHAVQHRDYDRDRRPDDSRDRSRDYGRDREKDSQRVHAYDRDRRRDADQDRHRDRERDRERDRDRDRYSRDYEKDRDRDRRDRY